MTDNLTSSENVAYRFVHDRRHSVPISHCSTSRHLLEVSRRQADIDKKETDSAWPSSTILQPEDRPSCSLSQFRHDSIVPTSTALLPTPQSSQAPALALDTTPRELPILGRGKLSHRSNSRVKPGADHIAMGAPTSGAPLQRLPVRLFIASLGNPPPYHATRHSAGHVLLKSIQSFLHLPTLSRDKSFAGGHISQGSHASNPAWTLFQSPTQMNVSGTVVLKAYKNFLALSKQEEQSLGLPIVSALVVLHDEMETSPGTFKIRFASASAKGHNGIKSVQSALQSAGMLVDMSKKGKEKFIKVGIGIGRPAGRTRERADVSDYVLGQLSQGERTDIESMTGKVIETLAAEMERLSTSG